MMAHAASGMCERGYAENNFQCPSEMTSTVPSVTLMAVWSSIAYAGHAISADQRIGSRTHYLAGSGKLEGMTTAAERLLVPGPEEQQLAGRAGTWTVTATMWPAPGAGPIVTGGLVAERTMIGLYLQETMRPAPGGTGPDFRRIDYLHYDRVEGRWKYVSMDTRLPVSIMPARSFGPAENGTLRLQFEPLGFVGFGDEVGGTLMQSDMRITTQSPGRELKEQHFIVADGTAREWLAVQYEYRR